MNLWDEVVTSLNEEMENLKMTLAEGGAEDYPSYKELIGFYKGLGWARNDLTRIVRTRFDDNQEGDT
tara:strand:+ start:4991 stop:5191 length:201 start_codon:yes stop_codon:yes gene_type:complete